MAKKGIHRSPETEFRKGHQPRGKPFNKRQTPWNKGLKGAYKPTGEAKEKARQAHIGLRYNNGKHWAIKICQRCNNEFEVRKGAGHKDRKYCSQECARLRGRNKLIRAGGYLYIWRDGKYIAEQRIIAEQALGRSLKKTEIVHHNNGDKLNNGKENLTVMSQACHRALVDFLARLWIKEHLDMVNKITNDFTISFSSGG